MRFGNTNRVACLELGMRDMAHEEAFAFLETGTRTGKVATIRADGSPHVTPIWFVIDRGDIVFNTWHTSPRPSTSAGMRESGWS